MSYELRAFLVAFAGSTLVLISTALLSLIPPSPATRFYHTETLSAGQVLVVCDNGGDATIRPSIEFGEIVVDCGTRQEEGTVKP